MIIGDPAAAKEGIMSKSFDEYCRSFVDINEAPPGFYAVAKKVVTSGSLGNICRACDWRPNCNGTDYHCMATPVITPDGTELFRKDGQSVVFKMIRD